MDFTASPITELQVNFEDAGPVTFETRNCSAGADPVLHLFRPGASTDQRIELAADDNSGGGVNARITATVGGGSIGFLVLHAKNDAYGTCDIWRNGYPWQYGQTAGGKTIDVVAQAGDAVETVAVPHGFAYHAIYLLSGISITQKYRPGSGTDGAARFVLSGTQASFLVHGSGPTRVVVNDERADSDGDGLGDKLEAAIGTCPSFGGSAPGVNCSQVRTPKDTDGDGISDAWEVIGKRDLSPHQPLVLWWANPRHKDLFVEVDYRDDGHTPQRMSATTAHVAASYWQDTIESLPPAAQAQHAALLRNPDGLPGVAMHIDSGLPAAAPEDETLYGSWGGYDVLPAGSDYGTAWQTHMAAARRGVFHWALGTSDSGGQTSGFANIIGIGNGAALAHELGHTMGINHWGQDPSGIINCKPNYASPMNYAYSYAGVGFSDGLGPAPMNNTALAEYGILSNAPNRAHFADLYQNVFGYYVDRATWSVDFDRDGDIAPSGALVRAFANSFPGGNCEGVRERRTANTNGSVTGVSPAIVRAGSKVLLFDATSSGVELRVGADTYFGCATAGGGNGDMPCGTFGELYNVVNGAVSAVDAVNVGGTVLLTLVDSGGSLRTGTVTVGTGSASASIGNTGLFAGVLGEPSMVAVTSTTALLVFRAADGTLKESHFTAGQGWSAPVSSQGPTGAAFKVLDAPGLVVGRMPGDTADAVYMQATHTVQNAGQPSLLKLVNGKWTPTSFFTGSSNKRPALAYVPNAADPSKGKMYALYPDAYTRTLTMRTSGVSVFVSSNGTVTKTPVFGFESPFDNVWATGAGVDLLFEPGKDTNLRAAVVYDFGAWNGKVVFQPLADGIVDLTYGSSNDWAQIGLKACAAIANPGNLVQNPMPCF